MGRYEIIVSELMDASGLGESLLSVLEHACRDLASPGAQVGGQGPTGDPQGFIHFGGRPHAEVPGLVMTNSLPWFFDGPNRNRWFTVLKHGGSFRGYVK